MHWVLCVGKTVQMAIKVVMLSTNELCMVLDHNTTEDEVHTHLFVHSQIQKNEIIAHI